MQNVVITGGSRGIGRAIAEAFHARGDRVAIIDRAKSDTPCALFHVGDIGRKEDLEAFARACVAQWGQIDVLVNNAMETRGGYPDCGWEDFLYAQAVGVAAPYYLTTLLAPHFGKGASVINISSTRAFHSQQGTESYTAAKGGITALTHALAMSLAGKARVNAIAPGWIDTTGSAFTGPDASQHAVGRVGVPDDIAQAVLFLCSDKATFITGQVLAVDGGMSKRMIYHGDEGWTLA